jgi:membrane associated rhomboid family serine protease
VSAAVTLGFLYDRQGGSALATRAFLIACYLVTVPSLIYPRLYAIFGGIEPRAHAWQLFTAVFEHGWPGFPGALHLLLNTVLILECGVACERLLGTRRFVALSVAAAIANAGTQLAAEGANGSSLVIWAWGPPLMLAMIEARRLDPAVTSRPAYARARAILLIMYVGVTLAMPLIPFLLGWRGNPLVALLLANQYHLVAAIVGGIFALLYRERIRQRAAGG